MAQIGRLAPYGAPGRYPPLIGESIQSGQGDSVAQVTVLGVSLTDGIGASTPTVTVSGAGGLTSPGIGDTLVRGIVAGFSSTISGATGASLPRVTTTGVSTEQFTRLGLSGTTSRLFPIREKADIVRLFQEDETLGIALNGSDFNAVNVELLDSLGANLTPDAIRGSIGDSLPVVTVNGIGGQTAGVVGASTPTVTISGAGGQVQFATGDGASAPTVTVNGVGTTVSTTFGLGVGSSSPRVVSVATGISRASSDGVSSPTVTTAGIGGPLFSGDGVSTPTVTVDGTPTSPGVGASAPTVTVAGTAIWTHAARGVVSNPVTTAGVGVTIVAPVVVPRDVWQINIKSELQTFTVKPDRQKWAA